MRHLLPLAILATTGVAQTWAVNPANGHTYVVGPTTTSWVAGEALAQSLGAHLATIRDASEQAWLEGTFASQLGTHGLWIGFNDIAVEGQWAWSSGEAAGYTNWAPGSPDNGTTIAENAAHLFGSIGGASIWKWNDETEGFSNILRPLIEVTHGPIPSLQWFESPANGHFYALTPQMSWTDSELLAQQYGGHLATVRSASENAWLASTFFSATECHWIGLNDAQTEGVFEWVSGEPTIYTNWYPGEPTNGNGVEDWCHLGLPWAAATAYPNWNDSPNGPTSYGWVCRGIIEVDSLTAASYATFGNGCSDPYGAVPVLGGVAGSAPVLGTTSTIGLSNLPLTVTVPIFVFGTSNTVDPGPPAYSLPLDLSILGWPGCSQLVSDDAFFFAITTTGQADFSIDIPLAFNLVGYEFHAQAFVLYSPSGVAVSNGVTATVGL